VRVALISGGIRQAIIPFAKQLGIAPQDVHAVDVVVDMGGQYFAYDAGSPLATQGGKREVAANVLADAAGFPRPALAVGDGATDTAMRGVADAFAAFTGVVRREPVVRDADLEIASFDHLVEIVLA
jgi:phosphoserine phosphatase